MVVVKEQLMYNSKDDEIDDNKDDSGEGKVHDNNNIINTINRENTANHSKKGRKLKTNFNNRASHSIMIQIDDGSN